MLFSRCFLTAASLLFSTLSMAQEGASTKPEFSWSASAGGGQTRSDFGRADEQFISLRHYTPMGSIALEELRVKRFGSSDAALAIDAYPRLWEGAYANVRYQYAATPDLYPQKSWRTEIYQNVGGGWELAASHDHLGFTSPVKIEGVAVGKYWGNFFARWRHQRVSSDGSVGQGDRFMLRYYYEGDADNYLEANVSSGRSDDFGSAQLTGSRSDSKGLAWRHFLNRHWGLKASVSEALDSSSAGGKERSVSVGLSYRW